MSISVIIPVLRERDQLNDLVKTLAACAPGVPHEVIVVDGDPLGGTIKDITDSRVITLIARQGRAGQMNAGALRASGDILLFLHADTRLPRGAFGKMMKAFEDGRVIGGAFDLGIDDERRIFKIIGRAASWKHRLTRVPYGDQAIFMRKSYFMALGGYPEIPIMEDVALMKRVKRKGGRIAILPDAVATSPRKWEADGVVYTVLRNWMLQSLYLMGIPAHQLVKFYYKGWSAK